MSPREAAYTKSRSQREGGTSRAARLGLSPQHAVPAGILAGPGSPQRRGEGSAWQPALAAGSQRPPLRRAAYSMALGNSLTSAPAALLGSGGSQDDKALSEEIPFLVRGSGGAGHARPPRKHVHSPRHTHGRAPRPGAGSAPLGDLARRGRSFMAKSSSAGKQCWRAEPGALCRCWRSSRSVQPLAPPCPCGRRAGWLSGCRSHACALRPQPSQRSRDVAAAGGWSSPLQGHGCVETDWGRELAFLLLAEFEVQIRW